MGNFNTEGHYVM